MAGLMVQESEGNVRSGSSWSPRNVREAVCEIAQRGASGGSERTVSEDWN